jgi:hypothetical protein
VAKELQLSVKTIETHRQHIKQKLGLAKGTELTRQAADWMLSAVHSRMKHISLLFLTIANDFGFELVKLHEDVFQSADASLVMALF